MKARTQATASARRFPCTLTFGLSAAGLLLLLPSSLDRAAARQVRENELTAHEWGTFTSTSDPMVKP